MLQGGKCFVDRFQLLLGLLVATIGVRMQPFHQLYIARFDLGKSDRSFQIENGQGFFILLVLRIAPAAGGRRAAELPLELLSGANLGLLQVGAQGPGRPLPESRQNQA